MKGLDFADFEQLHNIAEALDSQGQLFPSPGGKVAVVFLSGDSVEFQDTSAHWTYTRRLLASNIPHLSIINTATEV